MTDQANAPIITAVIGERMKRLATARAWRSAIKNGDIERGSGVGYELPGQPVQMRQADQCPELAALFDEILGEGDPNQGGPEQGGPDQGGPDQPDIAASPERAQAHPVPDTPDPDLAVQIHRLLKEVAALSANVDGMGKRIAKLETQLEMVQRSAGDMGMVQPATSAEERLAASLPASPPPAPPPPPPAPEAKQEEPPPLDSLSQQIVNVMNRTSSVEGFERLARDYNAVFHSNSETGDRSVIAQGKSDRFWVVPVDGAGAGAILLPGFEVFRFWHIMRNPAPDHPLGYHFDMKPGRKLQIVSPAKLHREKGGAWKLVEKGVLIGMQA